MRIHVLGSSAGGGLPQWNCNCPNCQSARDLKQTAISARTQSSIALTDTGDAWVLFNASPDIRQQLNAFPELLKPNALRGTKIKAVILVDSQIDHTLGLMLLREGETLQLYCSAQVYEDLSTRLPLVNILQYYCGVQHHLISPGLAFSVPELPFLEFTPIGSLSKAPPYSAHRENPELGDNLAFSIYDQKTKKTLLYAPAIEKIDPDLYAYMENCDHLLLDGTFWSVDEMSAISTPYKKAYEMGHLAYSGPEGMMAQLRELSCPKTLIHINNTNPVLDQRSEQYQILKEQGFDLAYDTLEILL